MSERTDPGERRPDPGGGTGSSGAGNGDPNGGRGKRHSRYDRVIALEQQFRGLYHKRLVYHSTLLGVLVTLVGAGIWRGSEPHHFLAIAAGGLAIALFATVSPSMLRPVYCQTLELTVARERFEVREGLRRRGRSVNREECEECPGLAALIEDDEADETSLENPAGTDLLFPLLPSSSRIREPGRQDRFAPRLAAIVFAATPLLILSLPSLVDGWLPALYGLIGGLLLFLVVYRLGGYRRKRDAETFDLKWCPEKRVPEIATAFSMAIALALLARPSVLAQLSAPTDGRVVQTINNPDIATGLWFGAVAMLGLGLLHTLVWSKGVGDARARLFEFREDVQRLLDASDEQQRKLTECLKAHVAKEGGIRLAKVDDVLRNARESGDYDGEDLVETMKSLAGLPDPDKAENLSGLVGRLWKERAEFRGRSPISKGSIASPNGSSGFSGICHIRRWTSCIDSSRRGTGDCRSGLVRRSSECSHRRRQQRSRTSGWSAIPK